MALNFTTSQKRHEHPEYMHMFVAQTPDYNPHRNHSPTNARPIATINGQPKKGALTKRYITDATRRFSKSELTPKLVFSAPEMNLVKTYPRITYQTFTGMGAALTESAGYVYAQMPPATQRRFLELCFSEKHNHYSLCRIPLQSCDFSVMSRSYMQQPDKTLGSFSIDDD